MYIGIGVGSWLTKAAMRSAKKNVTTRKCKKWIGVNENEINGSGTVTDQTTDACKKVSMFSNADLDEVFGLEPTIEE